MTTERHILHFTIGPVQGFVAQARRTRDLWAGSFLLSWLAGQAIVVAQDNGATIKFPVVDDDLLIKAIRAVRRPHGPDIGTVPNRFKAEVPADFDPRICADIVRTKWEELADEVWKYFIEDVADQQGRDTEKIWKRQVENFWEIAWVMGPQRDRDEDDGTWLDRRKNWRSHVPPEEGGDHCTLMGAWQEISGYVRYREDERNKQDEFWRALQAQKKKGINRLELRDGERLCAIALVKRLFPRLPSKELMRIVGWVPGDAKRDVGRWPSTGAIAAAHWIVKAVTANTTACDAYAAFVRDNLSRLHFGEQQTRIRCLKPLASNGNSFAELDANFYQLDDVGNDRALPLYKEDDTDAESLRPALIGELKTLNDTLKKGPGTASSYFAILLMDGDRVGELISKGDAAVSGALNEFTAAVPGIVDEQDGVTIYCGGDDVLAMLPIETAIETAAQLREAYVAAFAAIDTKEKRATVSAGIVMADHHEPLRQVMDEAHRVLTKVAKDGNGRDSIAVSLLKPSGPAAEWVAKWAVSNPPHPLMQAARDQQVAEANRKPAQISNRFVYRVRERYLAPFRDPDKRLDQTMATLGLTPEELRLILRAELGKTREEKGETGAASEAAADALIETILSVSKPRQPEPAKAPTEAGFDPNGLLLIRFLAEKGLLS